MSTYVAIVGDVVNSRDLKDRSHMQKTLEKVIDSVNERYKADIASKFTILMGDSFQGLLTYPSQSLELLFYIQLKMHPIQLRYGIGIGPISTEIDSNNSNMNDGPAYHYARQCIEEIENSGRKYQRAKSNILVGGAGDLEIVNASLALLYSLQKNWTHRQMEVIHQYLKYDRNQMKTGQALGISQSSVSRSLQAADFQAVFYGFKTIQKYLNKEILSDEK